MFMDLLDPDPLIKVMDLDQDPSVIKQNIKKNLGSYCFVTFFDFLSLKIDVNVPSKSNRKTYFFSLFFVNVFKVKNENSRIQIHHSGACIPGSGSVLKCHGSATLAQTF
jgi:hypothetical protein